MARAGSRIRGADGVRPSSGSPREKKLLLLREPERLGALLPTLAAEEYTHQPGVSLEMCLEGQYDER